MKTLFKNLSCCICDDKTSKSLFLKKVDGHDLMRCQGCGLTHLDCVEVRAEEFLDDVTQGENQDIEYWGYPEYFTKHQEVFNFFFTERYQRIKSNLSVDGDWLDVGSGFGLWQSFLSEKNLPNQGLEIEKNACLHAQQQGLNVHHISIENFASEEKYAVISMCDVLEHVESPQEVLKKCHNFLKPGGLLYLQVPNVMGFKYPYGDSLGLPHHLWQFDHHTLPQLTSKMGFETLNLWTGIQGVIKYYEKGGPSFFRKLLWDMARWSKRGNRLQLLVTK